MSEIVVQETQRGVLKSGGKPMPIVPQDYDGCYRMAQVLSASNMTPKGVDVNDTCVAIMMGMEIGLTPMNAIQNIAVINGRPSIWGDAAMALVRGSGLVEYIEENQFEENGKKVATCKVHRKGEPNAHTVKFTQQQAITAGLWGGNVWKKYPERMLQMRARAYALRDVFPDVLKGISIAEEVRDYNTADTAQPVAKTQQVLSKPPTTVDMDLDKKPEPEIQGEVEEVAPEPEIATADDIPVNPETVLEQLKTDLDTAENQAEVEQAWAANDEEIQKMLPNYMADAAKLYDDRLAEVG